MSGVDGLDTAAVRAWVEEFVVVFAAERDRLTELDRRSGDGDFGANLAGALRKVERRLAAATPGSPRDVLTEVSLAFLDTGGTSGPLFGMFFRDLARAQDGEVVTAASLARGVGAGTSTVQRLGGASPGDKTMVDVLVPAVDALQRVTDGSVTDAVAAAARAAREGADGTEALRARRGRASYVGEVAVGVLDPGAVTVALWFEAGTGAAARA